MIKLYTIEGCQYCNQLKELLDKDGIKYEIVDVSLQENEAEFEKIYEVTKTDHVPTMKIGNQVFAPNVSFNSISEAFGLAKKFGGDLIT
jgi:glutaredoxin